MGAGGIQIFQGVYKYINIFVYPPHTNILIYLYGGYTKFRGIQIFHDTGSKIDVIFFDPDQQCATFFLLFFDPKREKKKIRKKKPS